MIAATASLDLALAPGETNAVPSHGGVVEVSRHGRTVWIGPWIDAGTRGCTDCAARWEADVRPVSTTGGEAPLAPPHRALIEPLIELAVAGGPDRRRRIHVVDLATGAIGRHGFVPHPACERCARLAEPRPRIPDLTTPQPTRPGALRVADLDARRLREALVDWRFGPIAHVYRDEESPFPLVTAETVVPGHTHREGGYGRSSDFAASELPAVVEGVERAAGGHRDPSRPTVTASYAELGDRALDPRRLARHPEPVGSPDAEYPPFDPEAPRSWVEGWSLTEDRAVLVPEQLAYWHEGGAGPKVAYETSNGCAVGGSLEEAALYGFFEIAERDGFLMAWLSRSRLVEVELAGTRAFADARLRLERQGLGLRVLDATTDLGVPTAIAIITAPDADVRSDRAPALSLAAGAHADPMKAIGVALEEAVTNALMYPKWITMRDSVRVEHARPLLDDFDAVHVLEDHTRLHGLVEARPLWGFLDEPAGSVPLAEYRARFEPAPGDVAVALRAAVRRAARAGVELVVVDQTLEHLAELGLFAVKVIAPGTLPMTFGHGNRRVDGVVRLARANELLHGSVPAGDGLDGRLVPHPFP